MENCVSNKRLHHQCACTLMHKKGTSPSHPAQKAKDAVPDEPATSEESDLDETADDWAGRNMCTIVKHGNWSIYIAPRRGNA